MCCAGVREAWGLGLGVAGSASETGENIDFNIRNAAQNLRLSHDEQARLAEEVAANYYGEDVFKQPATAVDRRNLGSILSEVTSQWDEIQHAVELGEQISPAGKRQIEEISRYCVGHEAPQLLARQLLALSLAHPLKTYFEDPKNHGELTAIIRAIDIIQRIMSLRERAHE